MCGEKKKKWETREEMVAFCSSSWDFFSGFPSIFPAAFAIAFPAATFTRQQAVLKVSLKRVEAARQVDGWWSVWSCERSRRRRACEAHNCLCQEASDVLAEARKEGISNVYVSAVLLPQHPHPCPPPPHAFGYYVATSQGLCKTVAELLCKLLPITWQCLRSPQ